MEVGEDVFLVISYVPEMGRYKAILVLNLQGRLEKPVHKLESLLLVFQHPSTVNSLQVQVEETFSLAAANDLVKFGWLLREQTLETDRLHRIDGGLLPIPLNRLGDCFLDRHRDKRLTRCIRGKFTAVTVLKDAVQLSLGRIRVGFAHL